MIGHCATWRRRGHPWVLAVCLIAIQGNVASAANDGNPLAAKAASGASDAPTGVGVQTLGAFSVLGSNPNGETLFLKLPAGQTLEAAITRTADELGKVLDAKPTISGAFANAQSRTKGGATLTGKLKGQDMQGAILCGVGPSGGSATVIVVAANAPKEDMAQLLGCIPVPFKMTTHKFSDNSGSIDLPDGWTTPDQTASFGIGVRGPAGQAVVFGVTTVIYEPNSLMVRSSQQTYQIQLGNYQRQMQMYQQSIEMHERFPNTMMPKEPVKPEPPNPDPNVQFPFVNFCRYCDGADDVLKYWYPTSEEKQKRRGKGYSTLDKVIEVLPAEGNPYLPKSKAGVAYLAITDHEGDKVTHLRVLNRMVTCPVVEGECWQLSMSAMRAPDATFDGDLPVMNAIMNSVNLNMDVVNKQIAATGEATRKMGADMNRQLLQAGREFRKAQDDHFNKFESQMAAQQQAMHDSSSDFIEYIRGVRDVYDNQTGQMHSVDLFHVNGIVNGMNTAANDPNRFVQIPLRYER